MFPLAIQKIVFMSVLGFLLGQWNKKILCMCCIHSSSRFKRQKQVLQKSFSVAWTEFFKTLCFLFVFYFYTVRTLKYLQRCNNITQQTTVICSMWLIFTSQHTPRQLLYSAHLWFPHRGLPSNNNDSDLSEISGIFPIHLSDSSTHYCTLVEPQCLPQLRLWAGWQSKPHTHKTHLRTTSCKGFERIFALEETRGLSIFPSSSECSALLPTPLM